MYTIKLYIDEVRDTPVEAGLVWEYPSLPVLPDPQTPEWNLSGTAHLHPELLPLSLPAEPELQPLDLKKKYSIHSYAPAYYFIAIRQNFSFLLN